MPPTPKPTPKRHNHSHPTPSLFVVPNQRPERIEAVTILINVRHATPQTRLQLLGVVAEYQHDHGPRQRRKGRPGVVVDLGV